MSMREQLIKAIQATDALGLDYYTKNGVMYYMEVLKKNPLKVRIFATGAFQTAHSRLEGNYPDDLEILEGVDAIEALAFSKAPIRSVHIPKTVSEIGPEAFAGCLNLESVNLPEGITWIDGSTFEDCKSLKSVIIPKTVKQIRSRAFHNCTSLTNVTFQAGLRDIEPYAFTKTSLKSVKLPSSIKHIDSDAFGWDTRVTLSLTKKWMYLIDLIN